MDIYKKFGELAAEGIAATLCTIIETKGSTPRKAGSKMIVTAKGITYGSGEEVTLLCAPKPHAYLGMIGSKKKVALARELFIKKGLEENLINSIDMPIGIPMNCETPREIAISILARLIDIKNSKQAE